MTSEISFTKNSKINLFDYNITALAEFCQSIGEKPFRATQIIKWIHQFGMTDFARMTNLSLKLRQYLAENAEIVVPTIAAHHISKDGTQKWLLRLTDNNCIEMVFIPETDRGTLCISTQVGCPLNCTFCATGKKGFTRNLTTAEIISQLWLAIRSLTTDDANADHIDSDTDTERVVSPITNVVIMGMGEPLLNLTNVLKAVDLMLDDNAYGLSKYRVTISTAGLVPQIQQLSQNCETAFAISLHAPNDALRSQLMPINKQFPLTTLITACKNFYSNPRRRITIEYIMLAGINDSITHAKQLATLLRGIPCKINLIPYNSYGAAAPYAPSTPEQIDKFRQVLLDAGFNTITRKTRGADIAAACGQLAGE